MTSAEQNPNAPWWCWTENEPSTFRCRERHHDVRPFTPGTPVGISDRPAEKPTSARLREVQGALAASQADLTRVEAERDWERQVVAMLRENEVTRAEVIRERNAERDHLRAELAAVKAALAAAIEDRDNDSRIAAKAEAWLAERDLARAELASARQELELLRATHVPHTPEQEPK